MSDELFASHARHSCIRGQVSTRIGTWRKRARAVSPAPPNLRRALLATFAVAAWGVARNAGAQPTTIAVDYDAPQHCPSGDAFRQEIRARTAKAELTSRQPGVRSFSASISQDGERFQGRLVTTELDGSIDSREVIGDRCQDAASALALIIAIAVDPNASTAPAAELPALAPPPAPVVRPAPPPPARAPALWQAPAPEVPTSAVWSASLAAQAIGGAGPDSLVGPALAGELGVVRPGWLSPALRFGIAYADDAIVGGAERDAVFRRIAGLLEVCPSKWQPSQAWMLRPCAIAELGAVRAEGRSVAQPRAQSRLWATSGLAGRWRWTPATAWFLEADVALVIPLQRKVFVFDDPRLIVHESPWVTWRAAIGGGVDFL